MNSELHLTLSERACRTAEAWFIPGNSIPRWLVELTRCGMAEAGTRLFVVPTSLDDRTPAGLLVVPDGNVGLKGIPLGFPCAWVGKRLCIPVDAGLVPPISVEEANALCGEQIVFMHPTLGVSGFDPDHTVYVWQLLATPDERPDAWNHARHGTGLYPDLTTIVLAYQPTLTELFGSAAEEIANRPPEELPPAPEEADQNKFSWQSQLKDLIARGIGGAVSRISGQPGTIEWLNPLSQWAQQQVAQDAQHLTKKRFKEIHRLLSQLESDPDTGLRHAIPLKQLPHRGRSKPGARLGNRNVEFDPEALGGGTPADFWEVPVELQGKLRRLYAELATRELQLQNFRRAAYIYSHLLGDLPSAANALKQGRHYREAAVLYEDSKQILEAARCLEEGELLQEALDRYAKLELWPDMARIHEKRGDPIAARQIWRRVVDLRRSEGDHLEAGKLLDEKLQSPVEALCELETGWSDSPQAIPCLQALFELWSRLGQHDNAVDRLRSLREAEGEFWKQDGFLEVLIQQARRHPDARVRDEASNLCQVAIARRLREPKLPTRTLSRLINHLTELAPHDRLLCRDANRYLNQRRQHGGMSARTVSAGRDTPGTVSPPKPGEPLASFRLPPGCHWLKVQALQSYLFGVGWKGTDLVVFRASWSGDLQTQVVPAAETKDASRLVFEAAHPDGRELFIRIAPGHSLREIRFPVAYPSFPIAARGWTPSWLTDAAYPIACTPHGVWSLQLSPGQAVLSHHDLEGRLVQTRDVSSTLLAEGDPADGDRVCLAGYLGGAAVSLRNRILILAEDGTWQPHLLAGHILQISVDTAAFPDSLLVALESGVARYQFHQQEWQTLDDTMQAPLVASLRGGKALLYSGNEGCVVQLDSGKATSVLRFASPGRKIIAALQTDQSGEFALIDEAGQVTIHRSPAS